MGATGLSGTEIANHRVIVSYSKSLFTLPSTRLLRFLTLALGKKSAYAKRQVRLAYPEHRTGNVVHPIRRMHGAGFSKSARQCFFRAAYTMFAFRPRVAANHLPKPAMNPAVVAKHEMNLPIIEATDEKFICLP